MDFFFFWNTEYDRWIKTKTNEKNNTKIREKRADR